MSDSAGALTDSYDYAAFGEVLNETGATVNNYKYTGEQFDSSLNQYYLRARYYNQSIGRFTQQDTWMGINSDPSTLHKYLYTGSDPVNRTDPSGNFFVGDFAAAQNVQAQLQTQAFVNLVGISTIVSSFRSLSDFKIQPQRATERLSVGIAKIKVRQCQKSGASECKAGIPILILGKDDFENTKHVYDAQFERGLSPILTRRARHNWSPSRQSECKGKTSLGSGLQCDEYPFGTTHQGGLQNYKLGRVSLRPISALDNGSAGNKLGTFYNQCGVRRDDPVKGVFGVIPVLTAPSTSFICPSN